MIQAALVIRGLFINGFAYSRSKKVPFSKNQSINLSLELVLLFAVQYFKKVSTANDEGNLYLKLYYFLLFQFFDHFMKS